MRIKSRLQQRLALLLFLLALSVSSAVWMRWSDNPGAVSEKNIREREGDGNGDDDPRRWQAMFNRGRRTRDGRPAAVYRLAAKAYAQSLPLARLGPSPLSSGFRPLSAPPLGPSCDWTEMGPSPEDDSVDSATAYLYGNVSGRVTSLALDLAHDPSGNTLYVGTAYGGVWKTTNGLGGSPVFTPLSDPARSLAVGSVALDTSGGQTVLYVGTGELNMDLDSYYGVGILKSADGGNSWSLVSTANSGAISFLGLACSKILVDPSSPATVMAAMGFACCHPGLTNLNQGLYRSTDHGATWNQVSTVNSAVYAGGLTIAGHSFTDIVYDGSATFFAAVRFQGVYASTNHGASWTQLPSPFPSGMAPSTTNFARATLASRGATIWCLVSDSGDNPSKPGVGDTGLSQSVDGGQHWTNVKLPNGIFGSSGSAQGTYDQYVAAPPGSTSLLVGGIDVWSAPSVNGNSTNWTNLTNAYSLGGGINPSHPDQHAYAFLDASHWYIGNDGGVWSTSNSGGAFANLNNDLGTIQFYSVSPDPSAAGKFIGGSQDNGTALNHGNTGKTWTLLDGGDGGYTDASPSVPGQFYTENFNVRLFRSDNYGADHFQNTVIDANFNGISGDSSSLLVPYQVLPGFPVSVILGTSRVWKGPGVPSSDGSGWVTISNYLTGSNSGNILILAASPSNSAYIYATTTDNNTTPAHHVFSNLGGATWSDVTGTLPTGDPIQGLAIDPTNPVTAYVGIQGFVGSAGSGHVFQTTNGGTSWTDVTGNLPDAPVNSLVVDPQYPSDIYVATDVGVFSTQNVNGASTSWARMGTALPDSTVLQIKMAVACPRMLVAATHGRGAWSICPLSSSCPPTATPTVTSTPTLTGTPTSTPTVTLTPTITSTPTITFTPTITPTPVPGFSAKAQPNSTDGRTPIQFVVNLPNAAKIDWVVYNVADEAVYASSLEGLTGVNQFSWPSKNQNGEPLASGIYIYCISAGGDKKLGKIYLHH